MSTKKTELPESLSSEELEEVSKWLEKQGDSIPESVGKVIKHQNLLYEALKRSFAKQKRLLLLLQKAYGIEPKSEKNKSGDPIGKADMPEAPPKPKGKKEQLEWEKDRREALAKWHRKLANEHNDKKKEIENDLKAYDEIKHKEDVYNAEFTKEKEAKVEEEHRQYQQRLELGEGSDDPALQSIDETIIAGTNISINEQYETAACDMTPYPDATVIREFEEERERLDFTISVTKIILNVEKKVIEDAHGKQIVLSGNTATWGPSGYSVTWEFLSNISVLIVQYAMPMNRLSKLMSTKAHPIKTGQLARYLQYVARRFLPIYLHFIDLLSDSVRLMGDDTTVRVLEVNAYFKRLKDSKTKQPEDSKTKDSETKQPEASKTKDSKTKQPEDSKTNEPPWKAYRNQETAAATLEAKQKANEEPSLGVLIANELGFESPKRNKNEPKKAFHTTVVSGRSEADEPQSRIVMYRSHLGGFGNILEKLLEKRNPAQKKLTIQSDLSTANLVSEHLSELFDILYAGCAAHARRPFAIHEAESPYWCDYMLHMFKGLFIYEQSLDLHGRREENVRAVRDNDSRKTWNTIKEIAEIMVKRWSPKTHLGQASRYIIRHFDELTAYLDDPRIELTNNFSERMIRLEKLIEDSSLFRKSLEGRFALDILRSIFQTAIIAGVPLQEYVTDVLKTPSEEIENHPEKYTPYAYSKMNIFEDENELNTS